MRYLDEYRDAAAVERISAAIAARITRPWTIMEVCGGQTHALVRFGLLELLPEQLRIVHGPGCPVCVTPIGRIDMALELARRPEVILCTFGDMIRVPGSRDDLQTVRSQGADVRVLYSPLDALTIAAEHPSRQIVFFAVGFETTAPANALAVIEAKRRGLENFSMLSSHVLVPPAMEAILQDPENQVQGFLAAGHVCTVMGLPQYEPIARRYNVPIVATGFEPIDLMQGIDMCLAQLEEGRAQVENQYARSVRAQGNDLARAALEEVFEIKDRRWRGIGSLPQSGLAIRAELSSYDAERRFELTLRPSPTCEDCIAGQVLRGLKAPRDCPSFGKACTPEHPLGAPMVSSEGACAAYFRYSPRHSGASIP